MPLVRHAYADSICYLCDNSYMIQAPIPEGLRVAAYNAMGGWRPYTVAEIDELFRLLASLKPQTLRTWEARVVQPPSLSSSELTGATPYCLHSEAAGTRELP